MLTKKIALTVAGAALAVSLMGGTAHADDTGGRDVPAASADRANGTIECSTWGGTAYWDTDGNGIPDTHMNWPCFGMTYTLHF